MYVMSAVRIEPPRDLVVKGGQSSAVSGKERHFSSSQTSMPPRTLQRIFFSHSWRAGEEIEESICIAGILAKPMATNNNVQSTCENTYL